MRIQTVIQSGAWAIGMALSLAAVSNNPIRAAETDFHTSEPTAASLEARFASQVRPVLQERCFSCHGNGKHKGGLALDRFTSLASIQGERNAWRAIKNVVQLGMMPPEDQKQPSPLQVQTLAAYVDDAVAWCDCSGPRDPGRVMLHRLNRNEYDNTIRDLLGVDISKHKPGADFPADDTGYGFDNIADVLSVSPMLAEKYLAAAEQVVDRAIVTENPFKRKLVRIQGARMASTTGAIDDSGWNLYTEGEVYQQTQFVTSGSYELRVRAEADQAGPDPARMAVRIDGNDLETFDVTAVRGNPAIYTYRGPLPEGSHRLSVAFLNDFYDPQNPDAQKRDRNLIVDSVEIDGPIDAVAPPPSEGQKRILFVHPGAGMSDEDAAGAILKRFATRAFRRPATDAEVARLMKLYRQARDEGAAFEPNVKVALTATLVSPQFLFRAEPDPSGAAGATVRTLNDYELATRLSYFLWSSMPDGALFELAAAGKLHDPPVLDAQVRRMLADRKADAFFNNFVGQWLELRNLDSVTPNPKRFPAFDGSLKSSMRREGEMFFTSVVREDRPVLELLDADYTFINARLAKHYGIAGVNGDEFRRVNLDGDAAGRRGGVLTMAGVLTVTSMPARTSPVKRGKWILQEILGDAPPPPPPDVPSLPSKPVEGATITFRQRLEQHRADITCASCHARMDPLGLTMENYDAIGVWRDREGGKPVDASGKLPSGQALDGSAALKQLLVEHKADFVRCLTEKMLTYALGRGLEEYDRPTVHDICKSVEAGQFKASSLVLAIVNSDAFGKRRIGPPLRASRSGAGGPSNESGSPDPQGSSQKQKGNL